MKPELSVLAVVKSLACCQEWIWSHSRSAMLTWILLILRSGIVGLYSGVEQGFGHVHRFQTVWPYRHCWFIFSIYSVLKMTGSKEIEGFGSFVCWAHSINICMHNTTIVHWDRPPGRSYFHFLFMKAVQLYLYVYTVTLLLQHF